MKWLKIDKSSKSKPRGSNWRKWKDRLAEEGRFQCVYCAIPESSFGGTRNFHVEHYKPKSRFPSLASSYNNLFYSCAICNTFKGNDWPGNPNTRLSNPAYANPSIKDFNSLFSIDPTTLEVSGNSQSPRYMIEKLYLNRPQLIQERQIDRGLKLLCEQGELLRHLMSRMASARMSRKLVVLLSKAVNIQTQLNDLQRDLRSTRPYTSKQVKKGTRKKK